jgi:hypothetical protein
MAAVCGSARQVFRQAFLTRPNKTNPAREFSMKLSPFLNPKAELLSIHKSKKMLSFH